MDGSKKCFKCYQVKPLYQFYPHRQMGDGHLNKCKECTKLDSAARISVMKRIPEWVMMERARCRLKQKVRRSIYGPTPLNRAAVQAWSLRNPQKRKAQYAASNAVRDGRLARKTACEHCGASGVRIQKHHPDYSKPLDVLWLCT
jgi:hypothetical protein